jgi:hypothetical protein
VCTAAAAVCLAFASDVRAQTFETIGIRAQGMGGAFVAVADDATATWWNPAGLASGALFSGIWERGSTTEPGEGFGQGPAWRGDSSAVAVAFPAMGLSYYRLRVSELQPSTDGGEAAIRSLTTGQYGVTAGQSIGEALVVATTLKLVRAGRATSTAPAGAEGDEALDLAADLDTGADTSAGLDLGVMVRAGYARIGLTVRNLREPEFGEGDDQFVLERQARTGLALLGTRLGPLDAATVAVDADVTTSDTVEGESRHVSVGGELWMFGQRVGIRGGISRNTVGLERTAASAGLSLGVQGLLIDGVWTFGSDRSRRGWGIGARVTY